MNQIKRLLTFILFLGISLISVGYFYGIEPKDYKDLFEKVQAKFKSKDKMTDSLETKTEDKIITTPKKQKKKAILESVKEPVEFQPLPINPYSKIDKHSRSYTSHSDDDLWSLARYLEIGTKTPLEKARAIYVWLAENISYDDDTYNSESNENENYDLAKVWETKKAVCDGYSELFLRLGKEMDLEIVKISGFAKGYGYSIGESFTEPTHAWNLINIDGTWRLFDATWGAGYGENINGQLVSKKAFNTNWFNVDPYEAIFSHYPENPEFLGINEKISLREFENLPKVDKSYFSYGFDAKKCFTDLRNSPKIELPKSYDIKTHIKVNSAPNYYNLKKDNQYELELYIPRGKQVAVIDSENNWEYIKPNKGVFKGIITPSKVGGLSINVEFDKGGEFFYPILEYRVE